VLNVTEKLSLSNWLNNLLDVPSKDPNLIERTACAKCKWRNAPKDDDICRDCISEFNLGNWEFFDDDECDSKRINVIVD
jgi:hypothetical protein